VLPMPLTGALPRTSLSHWRAGTHLLTASRWRKAPKSLRSHPRPFVRRGAMELLPSGAGRPGGCRQSAIRIADQERTHVPTAACCPRRHWCSPPSAARTAFVRLLPPSDHQDESARAVAQTSDEAGSRAFVATAESANISIRDGRTMTAPLPACDARAVSRTRLSTTACRLAVDCVDRGRLGPTPTACSRGSGQRSRIRSAECAMRL
jgi:hypothetical protein